MFWTIRRYRGPGIRLTWRRMRLVFHNDTCAQRFQSIDSADQNV